MNEHDRPRGSVTRCRAPEGRDRLGVVEPVQLAVFVDALDTHEAEIAASPA
jgi:hypothetical protein